MMTKEQIFEFIDQNIENNKEVIKSMLLPCIGFNLQFKKPNATSKIGGYPPNLKNKIPHFGGQPLTFLGQISLEEISHTNNILPKKGFLCFFICTSDQGFKDADKNEGFRVIYLENLDYSFDDSRNYSGKQSKSIDEYSVSFFDYFTFPSYQDKIIERYNITDEDLDVISDIETDILFFINGNCETIHQLLGYPQALQGTVSFWWAAKYLGLEAEEQFSNKELELIAQEEENFILLLQLNFGDPNIDIDCFGDSVAYFGIHRRDL